MSLKFLLPDQKAYLKPPNCHFTIYLKCLNCRKEVLKLRHINILHFSELNSHLHTRHIRTFRAFAKPVMLEHAVQN